MQIMIYCVSFSKIVSSAHLLARFDNLESKYLVTESSFLDTKQLEFNIDKLNRSQVTK